MISKRRFIQTTSSSPARQPVIPLGLLPLTSDKDQLLVIRGPSGRLDPAIYAPDDFDLT